MHSDYTVMSNIWCEKRYDLDVYYLQYARALKEKGVDVKVIVFPNDTHAIER